MDRRQLLKSGIGLLCTIPIIHPITNKKLPTINKLPIPTQKNKIQLDLTPWDTRITDDVIINENSLGGFDSFDITVTQDINKESGLINVVVHRCTLKLSFKTAILEFKSRLTSSQIVNSTFLDIDGSISIYSRNNDLNNLTISNINKNITVVTQYNDITIDKAELSSLTLLDGFTISYPGDPIYNISKHPIPVGTWYQAKWNSV